MLIHEIRRRHDEAPEHEFGGHKLQFKANAAGDVVCDVPDEIAEDLLAATGGAMVRYEAAAAVALTVVKVNKLISTGSAGQLRSSGDAAEVKDSNGGTGEGEPTTNQSAGQGSSDGTGEQQGGELPATTFTITSPDGQVFDLGPMSDDEVREFAVAQGLPKPHHTKKGDKLKQFVIDSLKAA